MIILFVSKESFWYLVVLASDDLSYCFDIKIEAERKIAKKIVSSKWSPIVYTDDFVTGWKVAKNWLLGLLMLMLGKKLWLVFKTRQQGQEDSYHQEKFFVMIFPLAIVLTWMKEVLKTMKKKKY